MQGTQRHWVHSIAIGKQMQHRMARSCVDEQIQQRARLANIVAWSMHPEMMSPAPTRSIFPRASSTDMTRWEIAVLEATIGRRGQQVADRLAREGEPDIGRGSCRGASPALRAS